MLAKRADGGTLNADAVKALLADGAHVVAGWPLGCTNPSCVVTPPPAGGSPPPAATAAPAPPQATTTTLPPVASAAPVVNPPWGIPPWVGGHARGGRPHLHRFGVLCNWYSSRAGSLECRDRKSVV